MRRKPTSLTDAFSNRSNATNTLYQRSGLSSSTENLTEVIHQITENIDSLAKRFTKLEHRLDKLDKRLSSIERNHKQHLDDLEQDILDLKASTEKPKTTFYSRLAAFLKKRPTVEALKAKNYIRDEICFDTDLDKVVKDEYLEIPKIVCECCEIIEHPKKEFLKEITDVNQLMAGIYRVPGDHSEVQKLRFQIDANNYACLRRVTNIYTIASLLKLFFYEIKTPLITDVDIKNYNGMEEDSWFILSNNRKCIIVKEFLRTLPEINRNTLKYFLIHLNKLCYTYKDYIRPEGLAISTGPSVIRITEHHEQMEDRKDHIDLMNNYLCFMIINCYIVFD